MEVLGVQEEEVLYFQALVVMQLLGMDQYG
jgi:hypothetical protein